MEPIEQESLPVKKVKVQIGVSLDSAKHEVLPAASDARASEQFETSTKSLAELCAIPGRRRGRRKVDAEAEDENLHDVMPHLSKKPKAPKLNPANQMRPSFSSSKKEQGPRVEVVDGKIVIKESSLMVEAVDSNAAEVEYEEVEEGGAIPTSRYSSYSNKKYVKTWGIEETRLFYQILRQCGTEFSMMQTFFPHRTRRELKLKFIREENAHPDLMKTILNSHVPLELVPFEIFLGVKLSNVEEKEADAHVATSSITDHLDGIENSLDVQNTS